MSKFLVAPRIKVNCLNFIGLLMFNTTNYQFFTSNPKLHNNLKFNHIPHVSKLIGNRSLGPIFCHTLGISRRKPPQSHAVLHKRVQYTWCKYIYNSSFHQIILSFFSKNISSRFLGQNNLCPIFGQFFTQPRGRHRRAYARFSEK